VNEEAKRVYQAWIEARADYATASDPLEKEVLLAESMMLMELYLMHVDN